MLLTNRSVWNAIVRTCFLVLSRDDIESSLTQTSEITLYTTKQCMVAKDRSEGERWCHRILLSNVWTHHRNVRFCTILVWMCWILVRIHVVMEEGIVCCLTLMIYISCRKVQFWVLTDRQGVSKVSWKTVGTDVFCTVSVWVHILIIRHDTTETVLINRLTTQYELIVLSKRLIEVKAETKVIHRLIYAVRDTILVLYFLTCKTILCAVDSIHLCTLCEYTQTDVVITHRSRTLIALEAKVSELNITINRWLKGWFLWDNVDSTSNGTTSIEGWTSTLNYLKTVDVIGSNLLQTVNTGKTRVDWLTINEYLCVLSTQSLHTNLREITELALLFYADAWYTFKCFV